MKAAKVDHAYRDFSRVSLEDVGRVLARGDGDGEVDRVGASEQVARARSKNSMSFPRKLYEMVTNPDYQHIICFVSFSFLQSSSYGIFICI